MVKTIHSLSLSGTQKEEEDKQQDTTSHFYYSISSDQGE